MAFPIAAVASALPGLLKGSGGGTSASATGGSVSFNPAISVNVGSGSDLSTGADGYQGGSSSQAAATVPEFYSQGNYPGQQDYGPRYSIDEPLSTAAAGFGGDLFSNLTESPVLLVGLGLAAWFMFAEGK